MPRGRDARMYKRHARGHRWAINFLITQFGNLKSSYFYALCFQDLKAGKFKNLKLRNYQLITLRNDRISKFLSFQLSNLRTQTLKNFEITEF